MEIYVLIVRYGFNCEAHGAYLTLESAMFGLRKMVGVAPLYPTGDVSSHTYLSPPIHNLGTGEDMRYVYSILKTTFSDQHFQPLTDFDVYTD